MRPILIGEATIGGIHTVIGAMDTRFLMAMGYVVGEKITRSFEEATKQGTSGHFCSVAQPECRKEDYH